LGAEAFGPLFRIEGTFDAEKYNDILNDTVLPYIEHFHENEQNVTF
jgi:hypothetical protein